MDKAQRKRNSAEIKGKAEQFLQYPKMSIAIYNGSTILHFLSGGLGIFVAYNFSHWAGWTFGLLYVVASFVEMYIVMPLVACPNCTYFRMKNSVCISGLNLVSRKIAKAGHQKEFPKRASGMFCQNNLYVASLIVPIIAIIPGIFMNFSTVLVGLMVLLVGLLLYRVFVIFPHIACLHCRAKHLCPQAAAMGVRDR
jgi:hypothetical protein